MCAEVFRFVTIRPLQRIDTLEASDNVVVLGLSKSALTDVLRKLRVSATRAGMLRVVDDFIASPDFIDAPRKLYKRLLDFSAAVQRLPDQDFWSGTQQAFATIFSEAPSDFVSSEAFTNPYVQVSDSIVAAMIDGCVSLGA